MPHVDQFCSAPASPKLLRILAMPDQREERTIRIAARTIIGRAAECTLVLADRTVSRVHASAEPVAGGIKVVDLGSGNGIFVNERRVSEVVVARGDRCRIGSTVFTCVEDVTDASPQAPPERTVVVAAPPVRARERGRIEDEGTLVTADPHVPMPLDDPEVVCYVAAGGVRVFAAETGASGVLTTGGHLLAVEAGHVFCGFDLDGTDVRLLAEARPGTTVRMIPLTRWQQLAMQPSWQPLIASLVDTWVGHLSRSLVTDRPRLHNPPHTLRSGIAVSCNARETATAADGVVWVDVFSGSASFDDLVTIDAGGRTTLFRSRRTHGCAP